MFADFWADLTHFTLMFAGSVGILFFCPSPFLVSFLGNQNVSTHQIARGAAISQTLSLASASPLRMGQTVGTVVFTSLHSAFVQLEKEKRRPIV